MVVQAEIDEVRRQVSFWRAQGRRIGLVPTMGALHAGHLSLVDRCYAECDVTVATIFVNPTQFGPNEDLSKYPRTLDDDLRLLSERHTDLVFTPRNDAMYPRGFSTHVDPPVVAQRWEGAFRPGHFRGVATVVLKLFQLLPADVAFFGQKDYQQSLVVRRMVEDFNVPIEICVCPTVRDVDGLATSSRNRYLSPEERTRALSLSRALREAQRLFSSGVIDPSVLRREIERVLSEGGIGQIEYVAIVDGETLADITRATAGAVILMAVRVGTTRLIDNLVLS